jgi:amino-acid N-acetyltransferase
LGQSSAIIADVAELIVGLDSIPYSTIMERMSGTIRPATAAEWAAIKQLVSEAALPTDDLHESAWSLFHVHVDGSNLRGVIALEPAGGECALLRSLAVLPTAREHGIGRALVASIEAQALAQGVRDVFLLTTTAEPFFSRLGYGRLERNRAPASIRAHEQFRTLCPASAAFMGKRLRT